MHGGLHDHDDDDPDPAFDAARAGDPRDRAAPRRGRSRARADAPRCRGAGDDAARARAAPHSGPARPSAAVSGPGPSPELRAAFAGLWVHASGCLDCSTAADALGIGPEVAAGRAEALLYLCADGEPPPLCAAGLELRDATRDVIRVDLEHKGQSDAARLIAAQERRQRRKGRRLALELR